MLNERCKSCPCAALVTQTITGVLMEQPYWQCLGDATDVCLDGQSMNVGEAEPVVRLYSD